ncbi:NAD(P)-dependent oxidoreductase, partial [bacterium]|nr:NAD(P)-dependent oxidoreductase [bacterium]
AQAALYLVRHSGADIGLVRPTPAAAVGFEKPPNYSTLDTSRLQTELGIKAPAVWPTIESGYVTDHTHADHSYHYA